MFITVTLCVERKLFICLLLVRVSHVAATTEIAEIYISSRSDSKTVLLYYKCGVILVNCV